MNFTEKTKSILGVGVSLVGFQYEIHNWGLTKKQALDAIEKFRTNKVPILGGDVIYIENGRMDYTYDNWSTNRSGGESDDDYINRCAFESKDYIEKYTNSEISDVLFVLIPDDTVSSDPVLDQFLGNWSAKSP